jgi:Tfp pilus assembly protein PilO
MKDKNKIIITVLVILLVLAVGYIFMGKYLQWKQNKELSIYQVGLQDGYKQTITQIFQIASKCQQVPLSVENQTINLIATGCLKQ